MRTTIDLDKKLAEEVLEAAGEKSLTKAVNRALVDYVRRRRIEELRAMLGHTDLKMDGWYEARHTERS